MGDRRTDALARLSQDESYPQHYRDQWTAEWRTRKRAELARERERWSQALLKSIQQEQNKPRTRRQPGD